MIEVVEATSKKEFVLFPWKIYKKHKYWVPPLIKEEINLLDEDKNPFYKYAKIKLFLAYRDKEVVGRIAACINKRHNEYHKDKVGFFGFFDCINDLDVSEALLDKASSCLHQQGMDRMRGPMNPSMNDTCGLLVKGFFSPPVFMMPYNPYYYIDLLEAYGLKKIKDLYAHYLSTLSRPQERLIQIGKKIKKRFNITLRYFSKKNFKRDMNIIKNIYSQAWKDNWGFVPPTDEEIAYGTEKMKSIVPEKFIIIAEKEGEPCGYSLIFPDFNQALKAANGKITIFNFLKFLFALKKINNSRLITLGIVDKYRNLGIDLLLYLESFKVVEGSGYAGGELSWTLEDNFVINKPIEDKMKAELYKIYRIYEKEI
jgi:hypothetical protein